MSEADHMDCLHEMALIMERLAEAHADAMDSMRREFIRQREEAVANERRRFVLFGCEEFCQPGAKVFSLSFALSKRAIRDAKNPRAIIEGIASGHVRELTATIMEALR